MPFENVTDNFCVARSGSRVAKSLFFSTSTMFSSSGIEGLSYK